MSKSTSSTLEPGIYVLRSVANESVLDLSGGDNKSIIGFPRHGLENQQWEFGILGDGWYIRSMHTGLYLNIEKGLGDGFPVVANGYPAAWVVENEPGEAEDVFRITWPNTLYCFDLDCGSSTPGTKVNLWSPWPRGSGKHQLWQFQRCSNKEQDPNKVSEITTFTEMSTPETITTTTTTTTTTVTTTVVTRRNGVIVSEEQY